MAILLSEALLLLAPADGAAGWGDVQCRINSRQGRTSRMHESGGAAPAAPPVPAASQPCAALAAPRGEQRRLDCLASCHARPCLRCSTRAQQQRAARRWWAGVAWTAVNRSGQSPPGAPTDRPPQLAAIHAQTGSKHTRQGSSGLCTLPRQGRPGFPLAAAREVCGAAAAALAACPPPPLQFCGRHRAHWAHRSRTQVCRRPREPPASRVGVLLPPRFPASHAWLPPGGCPPRCISRR